MLVPIRNFGQLNANLYRSAQPMYKYEYEWLVRELVLEKIVNLRSELNHDHMFAEPLGIEVVQIPFPDHKPPTNSQAREWQKLVKENKVPMLFHCEHGHGRTSTMSVLAKMALGDSLEQALRSEKEDFGYEFKHQEQIDWLKEYKSI